MAKFRILFVDDDSDILDVWSRDHLEPAGYEVLRAPTERRAKEIIAKELNTLDLAIIDLKLRDVLNDTSGLKVAKAINGAIPVIILTDQREMPIVAGALKDGIATTVATKFAGPDGLLEVIKTTIVHRVFVAHGHDKILRNDVIRCLRLLRVEPVVLQEEPGTVTIPELIEKYSNVSFAVVLLTPDDVGAKAPYDEEELDLHPRVRQNVLLEWGFFTGRLGRHCVAALDCSKKGAPLDLPSNYKGLRTIPVDPEGKWQERLAIELAEAQIPVDVANVRI